MGRRKTPANLQYQIPYDLMEYGSWDYIQSLPRYDPSLYHLFLNVHGWSFAHLKKFNESTQSRYLFGYVKHHTDYFKELSKKFDLFRAENNWVDEYYNFCLERTNYVGNPFDPENLWIALKSNRPEEQDIIKKVNQYFREKIDYARFNIICTGNSLLMEYNEIKRDLPFVVGNIVVLRKRFIKSRHHDPFYWESDLKDADRIGHITSILNETHRNSYSGKGSRLVEVHWAASGKTNKQSVGSLKLLDQKNNKMVDKLVDE